MTSNGGLLELTPHPLLAVGSVAVDWSHLSLALVDVTTHTWVGLNTSGNATNHLSTFPAFPCGNRSMCAFRLEVHFGAEVNFSCPSLQGRDASWCFGEVRAASSPHALGGYSPAVSEPYHSVLYVTPCAAFEPPTSPACFAVESAERCGFGQLHDCRPCPRGAHCPGGYEARSFPGFYTLASAAGEIKQCDPAIDGAMHRLGHAKWLDSLWQRLHRCAGAFVWARSETAEHLLRVAVYSISS